METQSNLNEFLTDDDVYSMASESDSESFISCSSFSIDSFSQVVNENSQDFLSDDDSDYFEVPSQFTKNDRIIVTITNSYSDSSRIDAFDSEPPTDIESTSSKSNEEETESEDEIILE